MTNIWKDLKKPIMILAPMDDVTDSAFRTVVSEVGKPDLFFTEFANIEGIFSAGNKTVMRKLQFTEYEKPLIAQLWGSNPENYYKAAQLMIERGFDGVDINMGCPERSILKKGCCAALINNKPLAKEIIQAVKEGVMNSDISVTPHPDPLPQERVDRVKNQGKLGVPSPLREKGSRQRRASLKAGMRGKIPVSVKTRIGVNTIITEEWTGFLLEQDLDALIVHGRTVKEMSAVPAHWDEIGKVVKLRDGMKKDTVIIGNGDVRSLKEAKQRVSYTGVDGVMIGRGIFENIWIFNPAIDNASAPLNERLRILLRHMDLFESTWAGQKNFQILKKFFKIYVKGFDNASELRVQLMETKNAEEVREMLREYYDVD